MDLGAGWSGTMHDVALLADGGASGWVVLVLIVGLPFAAAVAVASGRRLAIVSLALSAAVGTVWFLHHATGWWDTSLAWSVVPLIAVGAGWCVLLVALGRTPVVRATSRAPAVPQ